MKNNRILVIDDESSVIDTYLEFLEPKDDELSELAELAGLGEESADPYQSRFEVVSATQGQEGLERVKEATAAGRPFAVAFIDIRMPPGWDGLETAQNIRKVDDDIHIVFVTAYSDRTIDEMQEALQKNAVLLSKPFSGDEVVQLARTLCISWNRERKLVETEDQLRYLSRQLDHQANHDALTGLANRRSFFRSLDELLQSLPESDRHHALVYLDLDQFKVVNDTCGHYAGDQLLQELSSLLLASMGEDDLLGRLGGDEFGILAMGRDQNSVEAFSEMVLQVINSYTFHFDNLEFTVGASVGIVMIEAGNMYGRDDLLKYADLACYEAKDRGRNQIYFHTDESHEADQRISEMEVVGMMNRAFKEDRFCLYAQPIVPLSGAGGQVEHYEVLIRMLDPSGEVISPGVFIPASERYGLIRQMDRWVLDKTFELLALRKEQQPQGKAVMLGVNLSGTSVMEEDLNGYIYERMKRHDVDPGSVYFEVTETAAIHQLKKAQNFIEEMKRLGFKFALDDFGSGMSSFSYLKSLPVDYLKIDGQFVVGLVENKIDQAMVKAMQSVSMVMGMESIAEFVEDEHIVEDLKKIGVSYAQGYYYDKPKPLEGILGIS